MAAAALEVSQEITGTITNARFLDIGDGKMVLAGTIIGDVRKRFRDGETIYTTEVTEIDGDVAVTKNSRYRFKKRH